jgi:hypothetical protein
VATIHLDEAGVHVRLSWFERIAGILRDQHIRFDEIESACAIDDPRRAIHGLRSPGFSVPGGSRIGTWRAAGTRIFVCVRGACPALRIDCREGRYRSLLVSVEDAADLAARIGS